MILVRLGTVKQVTGDCPGAANLLGQALETYRSIGDRLGESVALIETGAMYLSCGDTRTAAIPNAAMSAGLTAEKRDMFRHSLGICVTLRAARPDAA